MFRGNSQDKNAVITLSDYDEVLSNNDIAIVDFHVSNSVFQSNKGSYQGASITFNNYIQVSANSTVVNCSFIVNTSGNGRGGILHLSVRYADLQRLPI